MLLSSFFFLIDVVQALLDWVLIAVGLGFYMFYEYCMQARIMIFYLFIYFGGGGLAPLNFGNKYILVFTFWKLLFIPFNFTCFESLKVTCFLFSSLILNFLFQPQSWQPLSLFSHELYATSITFLPIYSIIGEVK